VAVDADADADAAAAPAAVDADADAAAAAAAAPAAADDKEPSAWNMVPETVFGRDVGAILAFPNPNAPPPPPPPHLSVKTEVTASWDFQYQPKNSAGSSGDPLDAYNVVCTIALANLKRFIDDAWCELLVYQHQLIAMVGCLIIDRKHPRGTMRFFAPSSSVDVKGGRPIEDMMAFRSLMNGAARIYSFSDHEFFGRLRCSPDDVTDLRTGCPWAPFDAVDDSNVLRSNPLRPHQDDPYVDKMNADLPHPVPQREEAEEITIPDIVLPPDTDWPDAKPRPTATPAMSTTASSQGSSSYNTGDSAADIAQYLASERWRGAKTVHKPSPPYLRDGEMIYWMLKSFSITADAELKGITLTDLLAWNSHQSWWCPGNKVVSAAGGRQTKSVKRATSAGVVDFARSGYKGLASGNRIVGQMQFTGWAQHKRWADIQSSLEWELRTLADLMTVLYAHRLPLLALVEKWNQRQRKHERKWLSASVSICTPSVLQRTHGKAEPPPNADSLVAPTPSAPSAPRKPRQLSADWVPPRTTMWSQTINRQQPTQTPLSSTRPSSSSFLTTTTSTTTRTKTPPLRNPSTVDSKASSTTTSKPPSSSNDSNSSELKSKSVKPTTAAAPTAAPNPGASYRARIYAAAAASAAKL
jgi:hypothetical protein